jgi:NADH:ubiquinone oxidoreductase subunit E
MEGEGIPSSTGSGKRNARGTTSIVWDYFNVQQAKGKVICHLCKQELCYNRNTSAMREHLKRKHVHIKLNEHDLDGERYVYYNFILL